MNTCLQCGKETSNPKFCSTSCAATYNNKRAPKRRKIQTGVCAYCGKPTYNRRKYCPGCYYKMLDSYTLADVQYDKHHISSAWALVRTRARVIMSKEPQVCCKCGYSKHVEVAHIRPIKDFPITTKVSEVNDKSNLMLLCPNCHWEFDHPNG